MYLNKSDKETIVCIAGCIGFMGELIEHSRKLYCERERMRTIKAECEKLLDVLKVGADKCQLDAIMRFANGARLEVVPTCRPEKNEVVVDVAVVERLLRNSLADCALCVKTGKDALRCDRRRDLLLCGIMPQPSSAECPFQTF